MIAIKVDVEKAYVRVRWDFLQETLELASFHKDQVKLIMHYVSPVRLSVL